MLMTRFSLAQSVLAAPPSLAPVFMQMDLAGAVSLTMWPFILIFLFMDVFDTIGTLIGVGEQGGFMRDNRLPRARQAMLADQAGTLVGACMGTSTVTSYIESITGVEAGGRTGLTGLTVAALFLLALFFSPAIAMVAGYPPITAPALVLVGSMMVQNVRKIDWSDASEATPSFLIMLGIPLSYSIGDGLALGFIAYPVIKLLSGRGGEVKWLTSVLAVVLFIYFVLIRSRVGGG
jgi:AGZA family xanthine/uracil permease-like MFS transporter